MKFLNGYKHFLRLNEIDFEGGGGTPPATPPEGDQTPEFGHLPEFMRELDLPDEIKAEKMLGNVPDVSTLVKNYVNSQKLVGRDKILKPSDKATPEEIRAFLGHVGLPENKDDYKIDFNFEESNIADDYGQKFLDKAFEAGVLPSTAKQMLEFQNEYLAELESSVAESSKESMQAELDNLKKEWGEAYTGKINTVTEILKEITTEEQRAYMTESGLVNDVNFIKLMDTFASKVGEGSFELDPKGHGKLAPAEALEELQSITGDMNSPYYDSNHPQHGEYMMRAEKLGKMAYPQ